MNNIKLTSEALDKQIASYVHEGETVCDNYWLKWKMKNQEMKGYAKDGEYLGGHKAPRHVERTSKHYFDWDCYLPNRYGKRNRSWGERIKPGVNGYTTKQLTNRCPEWEKEMIIEAETQLAVIRKVLDSLHECKVKIARIERSLTKNKEK